MFPGAISLDWKRFLAHFRYDYDIKSAYYYEGRVGPSVFFDKHRAASMDDFREYKEKHDAFLKRLKSLGFTVRTKPIGRLYNRAEGKIHHKCNTKQSAWGSYVQP